MKRIILILTMLMVVMIGLNSTITYGTVTSKTINSFAVYSGTTTVAVGDTTTSTSVQYIISPTFSAGNVISNKSIMIVGTVVADIQHTLNKAQSSLYADLQASTDGTNFASVATFKAYSSSANTAGTVIVVPASLSVIAAPYYRVIWRAQSALGVAQVADIVGTITTSIYISPNP